MAKEHCPLCHLVSFFRDNDAVNESLGTRILIAKRLALLVPSAQRCAKTTRVPQKAKVYLIPAFSSLGLTASLQG
jgi:hypothetical protein